MLTKEQYYRTKLNISCQMIPRYPTQRLMDRLFTSTPQKKMGIKSMSKLLTVVMTIRENKDLAQDDLYLILVIKNQGYAENLKLANKMKALSFKDIMESEIYATYYFSSEIGIIDMRSSKFRDEHNIKEHIIIISLSDISENPIVRMLFGWFSDFDNIIVNQVLFTFYRQGGFLFRNDTIETWYWDVSRYSEYRPSIKYDYNDNTFLWVITTIFYKFLIILGAIVAYAHISWINALLIRVAILCSNIVIFPILSCTRSILRANLNRFQIAAIYRSSPHIGALAAYLDRRRSSKCSLIFSFIACLMVFYFMFAACYFLWNQTVFPHLIAKGINDMYFFYHNWVEFMALFFIRTRSSIKYFPKLVTIVNIIFQFYINQYFYAAQYEMFYCLSSITMLLLFGFIKYFEQPSMNSWNPFGSYTPSITNPRAGYQLVTVNSFMLGFDIWTMFHPLKFRDTFLVSEQRQYDLLAGQEILGFDFDPQPREVPDLQRRVPQAPQQIQMAVIQRRRDQSQQLNQPEGDLERQQVQADEEIVGENSQDLLDNPHPNEQDNFQSSLNSQEQIDRNFFRNT
ncbi:UNKNOWN [Stylonychia lemnae]|uniref:Uncharacterized protein n=1 Tax=Stylonychia lemnae TaxID=5949 RepID=A0A078B1Z8_STYLE|nr:UNKNOWN [Stylonychia lemnae]|eukprot:CDW87312.1 UNKNOWN [Stylonychia lemnae]